MASTPNQQAKSFWLEHIEQWQVSEVSQADYCRQHGLCQKKFSYRKQHSGFRMEKAGASPGFSRVQVDSSTPAAFDAGLSLRLNNDACIEGITEGNLALVQPLLTLFRRSLR